MPTPIRWQVPTKLSAAERRVADKLHRIGKFYVFLREIRAELFDEAFEAELAAAYQPRGIAPLPPALLAMVTLLQAYDQVGDAEAVVTAQVDQRWQLALGCLGASAALRLPVPSSVTPASRSTWSRGIFKVFAAQVATVRNARPIRFQVSSTRPAPMRGEESSAARNVCQPNRPVFLAKATVRSSSF